MAGQLSGQDGSPAVTAVPRTSTSSSPGPGSGTGTLSLVRLAGSELDAHMARMVRTASFMSGVPPVVTYTLRAGMACHPEPIRPRSNGPMAHGLRHLVGGPATGG